MGEGLWDRPRAGFTTPYIQILKHNDYLGEKNSSSRPFAVSTLDAADDSLEPIVGHAEIRTPPVATVRQQPPVPHFTKMLGRHVALNPARLRQFPDRVLLAE